MVKLIPISNRVHTGSRIGIKKFLMLATPFTGTGFIGDCFPEMPTNETKELFHEPKITNL
jgi:hypothetical protein